MIIGQLISDYWILILLVLIAPYTIYFLKGIFKKNNVTKTNDDEYLNPVTDEEKYLGIKIENRDPEIYKERIEKLIVLLNGSKGKVSVSAIEAIMIVDLFSESVMVNSNGELVLDLKTAKKFSETIYNDPIKFISYIKSIEQKLDLEHKDNKIELGDALYMMRNAKKFGLNISDDEDTSLSYKIKSAIHEADYQDVVIDLVDDFETFEDKEEETLQSNIILTNTHDNENKSIEESQGLNLDDNIKSVEMVEDGKIRVIMNDDTVILKDDTLIYDVQTKEDVTENENNQPTIKQEIVQQLAKADDTRLADYINRFGELDSYEEKHKDNFIFKDRSIRFYDMKINDYQSFSPDQFKISNFFADKDLYLYFMSRLFNKELVFYNNLPHIYIGDLHLSNKKPQRYVTIDFYYFIAFVYTIIKRDDRESFFKFIFKGKDLNTNNVNLFLNNIHDEHELFYPEEDKFVFDAAYAFGGTTLKTKIIRFSVEAIGSLLQNHEPFLHSYSELKNEIDGNVKTKGFEASAKKFEAQNVFSQDTFFRTPIEDRPF